MPCIWGAVVVFVAKFRAPFVLKLIWSCPFSWSKFGLIKTSVITLTFHATKFTLLTQSIEGGDERLFAPTLNEDVRLLRDQFLYLQECLGRQERERL